MTHDEHTPSFDLPGPETTLDEGDMAKRIARRLFPSVVEDPQPREISHYRILRRLGAGGMGVVLAAEDQKLGRTVALKVLRSRWMSERGRRRLTDEARTLAKLSHPNIIPVYEVGHHGEDVYFTMEYVEGTTLASWQRTRKTSEILSAYIEAGKGLAAAHAAGLVHRDFKPSNVLVGIDGRVRVADFGLALQERSAPTDKIPTDATSQQPSGQLVGTPGYIAPELFADREASASSDQFAFCVALWDALSGTLPFDADAMIEYSDHDLPSPKGSVMPRWIRRTLLRGLALDPARRWPSVAELLRQIERTRRLRRFLWFSIPVTLTLMGAVFIAPSLEAVHSCEPDEGLDDVWNDERKVQLRTLGDNRRAGAIATELDRYAASWSTLRRETCEAHFEAEDLSAEGFDRAQDCLRGLHDHAEIVIDSLIEGSTPLDRADNLLDSLEPPRICLDLELQRARPLASFARFGRASVTRPRLDSIALHLARGNHAEARALAQTTLADSREGTPESAQALLLLGTAERYIGELEAAQVNLERAVLESERAHHPELRFRALREFAEFTTYDLHRPEVGKLALTLARAPLLELGEPPHLVAEARTTAALIAETQGEHIEAETLLREALAMQEQAEIGERPRLKTKLRIANSLARQGRAAEALALYDRVRADTNALLGPEHPGVGTLDFNIGLTMVELEDWSRAKQLLESALARQTLSFGADSLRVAQVACTLAEVETELGNYTHAIDLAEHATHTQKLLPPEHPDRNVGQTTLAWALLQAGDLEQAQKEHELLLAELNPAWADQRPGLHVTIGWLMCRQDHCADASAHIAAAKQSESGQVRAKAWALHVERELDLQHAQLAYAALAEFEGELANLPEPLETTLVAEGKWLRARVASIMREPSQRVHQLVEAALASRDFLSEDQIEDLSGLNDTATEE